MAGSILFDTDILVDFLHLVDLEVVQLGLWAGLLHHLAFSYLFHINTLNLAANFPSGVDCGHIEGIGALNDQKALNSVYEWAKGNCYSVAIPPCSVIGRQRILNKF